MRIRFCLGTALLLTALSAPVWAGTPVMLNPHIVLSKDVLTVGDVFDGAGPNADHVLAPAPKAGTEITLSAADLKRVADSFHLDWHSDDPQLSVTVERNATLVTPAMLAEGLGTSDLAAKIDKDVDITVLSPADGIALNGQDMPEMRFDTVSYDPLTQNFTATAILSRQGKVEARQFITGVATKMIDVPVLTAPLERGAQIGRSDVTTIRLPAKDVKAAYAANINDIVGMITRRTLDPQKPIAKADLAEPVLVKRNEIVTVTYQNGAIVLSTKARCLANGVKGEIVQLENPSSKKLIEAIVTGPQQVTVSLDGTTPISG